MRPMRLMALLLMTGALVLGVTGFASATSVSGPGYRESARLSINRSCLASVSISWSGITTSSVGAAIRSGAWGAGSPAHYEAISPGKGGGVATFQGSTSTTQYDIGAWAQVGGYPTVDVTKAASCVGPFVFQSWTPK